MAQQTPRLSAERLGDIANASAPAYDWRASGASHVHLGVGAFFKAHVAVYSDEAMARRGGDWRIRGVSLRRPDMRDALTPQDCLYTVTARDSDRSETRVVASIAGMLVAPENPRAVVAALAAPETKIVTLTITEKGYCLDAATGALDLSHPDIAHDLENLPAPVTAAGFLTAALTERDASKAPPMTIICCDNLPDNGARLRASVLRFMEETAPRLAARLDDLASLPSTMVDRITPATTADDLDDVARCIGLRDEAAVVAEPFSQWVIEDCFANVRPAWDEAGALFVSDVAPYELAKLRLLNGPHSAIAYLGYLAGHEFVACAMADAAFARFVADLQSEEIAPVTPEPEGLNLASYMTQLRARFSNASLKHRTWQIAMDGSQKLPQRLLNTIRAQLDRDGPIDRLALAIAAWTQYVSGVNEQGAAIDVRDPLAEKLAAVGRNGGDDPAARARAFLALSEVFGGDLANAPRFKTALGAAIASLRQHGAANAIERLNEGAGKP